eukprot:63991_1
MPPHRTRKLNHGTEAGVEQKSSEPTLCTSCGSKLTGTGEFCTNCGQKMRSYPTTRKKRFRGLKKLFRRIRGKKSSKRNSADHFSTNEHGSAGTIPLRERTGDGSVSEEITVVPNTPLGPVHSLSSSHQNSASEKRISVFDGEEDIQTVRLPTLSASSITFRSPKGKRKGIPDEMSSSNQTASTTQKSAKSSGIVKSQSATFDWGKSSLKEKRIEPTKTRINKWETLRAKSELSPSTGRTGSLRQSPRASYASSTPPPFTPKAAATTPPPAPKEATIGAKTTSVTPPPVPSNVISQVIKNEQKQKSAEKSPTIETSDKQNVPSPSWAKSPKGGRRNPMSAFVNNLGSRSFSSLSPKSKIPPPAPSAASPKGADVPKTLPISKSSHKTPQKPLPKTPTTSVPKTHKTPQKSLPKTPQKTHPKTFPKTFQRQKSGPQKALPRIPVAATLAKKVPPPSPIVSSLKSSKISKTPPHVPANISKTATKIPPPSPLAARKTKTWQSTKSVNYAKAVKGSPVAKNAVKRAMESVTPKTVSQKTAIKMAASKYQTPQKQASKSQKQVNGSPVAKNAIQTATGSATAKTGSQKTATQKQATESQKQATKSQKQATKSQKQATPPQFSIQGSSRHLDRHNAVVNKVQNLRSGGAGDRTKRISEDGVSSGTMNPSAVKRAWEQAHANPTDYSLSSHRVQHAIAWGDKEIRKLIDALKEFGAKNEKGNFAVKYGHLFEETTNTFEALSGTLKVAKSRGVITFPDDIELFFQRVHDDVVIELLKLSISDSAAIQKAF